MNQLRSKSNSFFKSLAWIVITILLISTTIWVYRKNYDAINYKVHQDVLARKLNVNIKNYPPEPYFPVGYFAITLIPGITVEEVHNIVKHYDKVSRCRFDENYYDREIYSYYSEMEKYTLRFALYYDRQEKYERIQGEDRNSGSLMSEGCETGLIQK